MTAPREMRFLLAGPEKRFLTALAAPDGKVKVTWYMGNKYFILDFIWKHTPKDAASVLDAFRRVG